MLNAFVNACGVRHRVVALLVVASRGSNKEARNPGPARNKDIQSGTGKFVLGSHTNGILANIARP